MQERPNIDLDELVSTLIKEKEAASDVAVATVEEPIVEDEPAVVPQDLPPIVGLTFDSAEEEELIEETEEEPISQPVKKVRKRRSRRAREAQAEDDWADWDLTPIGQRREEELLVTPADSAARDTVDELPSIVTEFEEESEPVEQLQGQDEFPTVTAVAETITLPIPVIKAEDVEDMEKTRVISSMPSAETAPADDGATRVIGADAPVSEEPSLDQLSLEELVRVEEIEDAPVPEEDAEAAMRTARVERVREFTLGGEEEEVNDPEEEVVEEPEEEPEIEDFTRYEDARAIQLELQYRVRTATVSAVMTGVLEGVILLLSLMTMWLSRSPIAEIGYLSVQIFALLLMCLLNYQTIGRGLRGLFSLRANADTLPALTLLVGAAGIALHFINLSAPLPLWTALTGLPILTAAVAQWVQAKRVRSNFAFVSYNGDKYAASLISEPKTLREIGQRVVIEGEARIAFFKRTDFLSEYLQNAYTEHIGDFWSRWMAPLFFGMSLVMALVLAVCGVTDGFWQWLQVFAFSLSLAAAPVSLAVQVMLSRCCRSMLRRGGFMVGWKAVDTFGSPDAVTVNVEDLYPDESMLLHGIKTFAGMHIDDAILDAASLAIRSGGPLARIFLRIIQDKTELLKEVENLVYEQGMGLSGWVDGRRVLVGNRNLLANHGVDVPSLDYEARYAKDGRRLVYLSTAGELSAMFVVSYLADEDIKRALQDLCRAKVTVLVRSCDSNVTAADLCESFELDDYYVEVLPAVAGRMYDRLMAEPMPSASAVLASNGHIIGISGALSVCRGVRIRCIIALVVSILLSVIGVVCGAMWAGESVGLLLALLLVFVGILTTLVIPLFKRL